MTLPPNTIDEAAALIRSMVQAQTTREKLAAERDALINEINERHDPLLSELDEAINDALAQLELFALAHPDLFAEASSVLVDTHRIGWTPGKWKVALADEVTEDDVIAELKKIVQRGSADNASNRAASRAEIASFLLTTSTALNKKRCLEESERTEVMALLGEVGVHFVKTPSFFVRPDRAGQKPAKVSKAVA